MKIIHCADLHLDSNMTSNLSKEKAKERKAELLVTFEKMITYAKENDVKAIIIAGDLYDKKNISASARNVFLSAVKDNPDIMFFYLKGNHDADSLFMQVDIIPDNIKLFDREWTTYSLKSEVDNCNITISGVELDSNNCDYIYNSLVLNNDNFNIVTLHGQETQTKSKDKTPTIAIRLLKNKGIDYLALGHIHSYKYEKLDARGDYCYPGCLEGRGFDECGEHGFVVLDIEDNKLVSHKLVSVANRNLYEVEVDITGCINSQDIVKRIHFELDKKAYDSSSLIKIVLTGKTEVGCEKNINYIINTFSQDYYFLKLYDDSKVRIDYNAYMEDKSLKGEFVRLVKAAESMDEDTKAAVINMGINALSGEDFI